MQTPPSWDKPWRQNAPNQWITQCTNCKWRGYFTWFGCSSDWCMNCGMRMCILCGGKKKLGLRGHHHACTGPQDNWFKITNKKYVKFAFVHRKCILYYTIYINHQYTNNI